jgi:hypothetical protein
MIDSGTGMDLTHTTTLWYLYQYLMAPLITLLCDQKKQNKKINQPWIQVD